MVLDRRAEVEAGRCAGAGLPPGAGQRARAPSRAEEGDGGGEEDGVAEVEAGHASGQGSSRQSKLAARAGREVGRSAGEGAAPLRLRRGPHWMFASSPFGEAEMPSDSPSTQNAYPVSVLCWRMILATQNTVRCAFCVCVPPLETVLPGDGTLRLPLMPFPA